MLMIQIDIFYLKWLFYGSRRMTEQLRAEGLRINRKRVQRLMREMGLEAIYPKPNLSKPHPQHKKYPYLLRNMLINRVNQVWGCDITYIPMAQGHVYLVAIIDWYSRYVLSWRVSNTLDNGFCVEALKAALERRGNPEIFNTDQGVQFTSADFTKILEDKEIKISMDGKGRCLDNVFTERLWRSLKQEEVVCCERFLINCSGKWCFIEDEGGPLGVGLQEQASNRRELYWLKALVVNVVGKGGETPCQVWIKETNENEPLMICRNLVNDVETGIQTSIPCKKVEGYQFTAQLTSGAKAA